MTPSPAPATAGAEMPVALDAPSGAAAGAPSQGAAGAMPAEAFGGPGTSVPSATTPGTGPSAGAATGGSLDLGAGAPASGGAVTSSGATSGSATTVPAGTASGGTTGIVTNYRPGSTGTGTVDVPPPPAPPAAADAGREYVIKSGDTLEAIARSQLGDGQKWRAIVAANPGINPTNLKIGQKIRLPAGEAVASKDGPGAAAPAATSGAASGNTYTVQRGDTLVALSRKFYGNDTEWKRILDANKSLLGGDPAKLKPGMKLAIPAKR
jgi:nucleoid-associated protein YgaU